MTYHMEHTDGVYFDRLKGDLIAQLIDNDLAGQNVVDIYHMTNYQKELFDFYDPYFERIIDNYGYGLITRGECFKSMIEKYNDLMTEKGVE